MSGRTAVRSFVAQRWPPCIALAMAYGLLVIRWLDLPLGSTALFVAWFGGAVYPVGLACTRLTQFDACPDRCAAAVLRPVAGLVVLGLAAMAASLSGSRPLVMVVLYGMVAGAWAFNLIDSRRCRPESSVTSCLGLAFIVLGATTVHLALLPPYQSGVRGGRSD